MKKALIIGVSFFLAFLFAEGLAHIYASRIAGRAKLFQPDMTLGWSVLPNLDLERLNADGQPWRIKTDQHGMRGPSDFDANASRRVLVIGDSFAFGQGVNLADRFDSKLMARSPGCSVVNTGVMGYGTYQEILAARPWLASLRSEDCLVLLTCGNDYSDILLRRQSGRAMPYVTLSREGELIGHLRDKSYLLSLCFALFDEKTMPQYNLDDGLKLYQELLRVHLKGVADRGVRVIVCFFGKDMTGQTNGDSNVARMIAQVRETGSYEVLDIDPLLHVPASNCFQADGHWNVLGHQTAADALASEIERPELVGQVRQPR